MILAARGMWALWGAAALDKLKMEHWNQKLNNQRHYPAKSRWRRCCRTARCCAALTEVVSDAAAAAAAFAEDAAPGGWRSWTLAPWGQGRRSPRTPLLQAAVPVNAEVSFRNAAEDPGEADDHRHNFPKRGTCLKSKFGLPGGHNKTAPTASTY